MKKTAVEWLQEVLTQHVLTDEQIKQTLGIFAQAMDIEEYQIDNAYLSGIRYKEKSNANEK
jgi:hypothetical protein